MSAVPATMKVKKDSPPPVMAKPKHLQKNRQTPLEKLNEGDSFPQQAFTQEQTYGAVAQRKLLCEPQSIGELVEQYYTQLPLCFSISESVYNICENSSLMEGQLLNVHFQKTMRVLSVRASQSGVEYTLPVSSSLEVSLLYNPESNLDKAKKGYEFRKVAKLINMNSLPQIICAHESFKDLNNHVVNKDGILFINKIKKVDESLCLVCTDMLTGQSRLIGEGCAAHFTTATAKIKMSLSKLLGFVKLPADVVFSSPSDGSIVLPSSALGGYYTILEEKDGKSVIVSTKNTSDESSSIEMIEILLPLSLDVQLVELSPYDLEKLRVETKQLCDSFHPSNVSKVICDLEGYINYIQTALFKTIGGRPGEDWKSIMSFHTPKQPSPQSTVDLDDDYEVMHSFHHITATKSQHLSPGGRHVEFLQQPAAHTLPQLLVRDDRSAPTSPTLHHQYQLPIQAAATPSSTRSRSDSQLEIQPYMIVRRESGYILRHETPYDYISFSRGNDLEVELLKKELSALRQENSKLQDSLGGIDATKHSEVIAAKNKQILLGYSTAQILDVLDNLGLSHYKEIFKAEKIDGPIFIELDDEVLEKELGVTLRLHRLKILRLLDGRLAIDSLKEN